MCCVPTSATPSKVELPNIGTKPKKLVHPYPHSLLQLCLVSLRCDPGGETNQEV